MPLISILSLGDWLRHRARLRSWNAAHAWGRRGEDLAHRYLQRKGYRILARNLELRGADAELDIVARDGPKLVFVEVKTRATTEFGAPEVAVDREKRFHLVRAAGAYLRAAGASWDNTRFDIVSVTLEPAVNIVHHRDAFVREEY